MTAISIDTKLSAIHAETVQKGGFDEIVPTASNDTFQPAVTDNTVKYSDLVHG